MARLRMIVAHDPTRMLSRAADGLFPLAPATAAHPWPTLASWVVLRQGGLRDDFHALAARMGVPGWFDPTVVLLNELSCEWDTGRLTSLSDTETQVLLGRLIRAHSGGIFGTGDAVESWVPALNTLIGELVAEGISADAFRTACDSVTGRNAFECRRDDAVADILQNWSDALVSLGRSDRRGAVVQLAEHIKNEPGAFGARLRGRRDVRIVGLSSVRGGYVSLLRALCNSPMLDTVTIVTSARLSLPPDLFVELIEDAHDSRAFLPRHLTPPPDGAHGEMSKVRLIEAPDLAREVETIAVRIRELIIGGAAAHRIAVVFRNERPGVDAMATALATIGVPVSARRRTALRETAPARSLRALLKAQLAGWSRHALLEVIENPLLRTSLPADLIDIVGRTTMMKDLADWESVLEATLSRCTARDLAGDLAGFTRVPLPATARISSCLDAWRAWLPEAQRLEGRRSRAEWFAWMQDVLENRIHGPSGSWTTDPKAVGVLQQMQARASDALLELARDWSVALAALDPIGSPIDAAEFLMILEPLFLTDLVTQPETDFGVVVGEAMALGWREFDHVFLGGLSSAEFPRRPSRSTILPDEARVGLIAAGLPLDDLTAWSGREDELFSVLCASPRSSLTLSWPTVSLDGREENRSRYVDDVVDMMGELSGFNEAELSAAGVLTRVRSEQVVVPGFPMIAGPNAHDAFAHAMSAAEREDRRSRDLSPWNGRIEDDAMRIYIASKYGEDYVWSATQLEGAAKCAWSWFGARQLGLSQHREASDEMDASASGLVLHRALDLFFEAARQSQVRSEVYLLPDDAEWAMHIARDAIDIAWKDVSAGTWMGRAVFHGLQKAELLHVMQGYLRFEMSFNAKSSNNRTSSAKQVQTAVRAGEYPFDGVKLTADGISYLLRGSVDRFDVGADSRLGDASRYFAVLDYKTSLASTPAGGKPAAWSDGVVLQLPLYAAVLRTLHPDLQLAHLENRVLRQPKIVHQLKFVTVKNQKGKSSVELDASAEEKMTTALSAAARNVKQVRNAEFAARPTDSCGCSPFCPARDVCRLPGGPIDTGWMS